MSVVPKNRLQLAVNEEDTVNAFTCSKEWVEPKTVMNLASINLALCNIAYLIPDEYMER